MEPLNQDSRIASSEYARRTIQLNRQIASLGAGFEFDFPRVAVVGAQSSGKSSLVEAISGINVPRDSGTCTKCPMECTVINDDSDTWSCTIKLKTGANAGGTISSKRFGPVRITDKEDVELWIRRAQTAILNLHRSSSDFEKMSAEDLRRVADDDKKQDNPRMLAFSKDLIEVEIRDPELPPLTFVDLPGLIQHHKESSTIQLVRNMVKYFIGGERRNNTLMLIVMPANEDTNNQEAMRLAKDFDEPGVRTIGVLTKPDGVRAGDIGRQESVKATLEGRGEFQLTNGYYCVRLPNDAERVEKLGRQEMFVRADKFFRTTKPWNEVTDRSVFGVANLVTSVSELLVKIIESNLPKLKRQVEEKLKQCEKELAALPPEPEGQPKEQLIDLLKEFTDAVENAVMGRDHRQYAQTNRGHIYARFRANVWRTGINFRPYLNSALPTNIIANLERDDESWNHSAIPEPERVRMPEMDIVMNLQEVRAVIDKSIAWELPGHVPFQATMELVQRSTSQWSKPALDCFNLVFDHSWRLFEEMLAKTFVSFDGLRNHVKDLTRKLYETCKAEALLALKKDVDRESNPLYTQNHHYFDSQRHKWRAQFANALKSSRGASGLMDAQEYQRELDLMGDVRAYFKVAYKVFFSSVFLPIHDLKLKQRFIDNIPMTIEHELSQEFAKRLHKRLSMVLLSYNEQQIKELMAEKPEIPKKRLALLSDISRLQEISRLLEEFDICEEWESADATDGVDNVASGPCELPAGDVVSNQTFERVRAPY
uniref:Dynamin family protein n=1 Tax=Moniliophthora roreri TaxID=221103 RepID=A0A0W0FIG9_MONRR